MRVVGKKSSRYTVAVLKIGRLHEINTKAEKVLIGCEPKEDQWVVGCLMTSFFPARPTRLRSRYLVGVVETGQKKEKIKEKEKEKKKKKKEEKKENKEN